MFLRIYTVVGRSGLILQLQIFKQFKQGILNAKYFFRKTNGEEKSEKQRWLQVPFLLHLPPINGGHEAEVDTKECDKDLHVGRLFAVTMTERWKAGMANNRFVNYNFARS